MVLDRDGLNRGKEPIVSDIKIDRYSLGFLENAKILVLDSEGSKTNYIFKYQSKS